MRIHFTSSIAVTDKSYDLVTLALKIGEIFQCQFVLECVM